LIKFLPKNFKDEKMSYARLLEGRFSETNRAYFITTVTHNRLPVFENLYCARDLIQCIKELHEVNAVYSLSWVVMPDHLHWLFQLSLPGSLHGVVKRLKGTSSRTINQRLGRRGALWQKAYYDRAVRDGEDLKALSRYIVANPLRAHLVDDIGHYSNWDAIWL
jgi:REP element-mobilizing transposase RayT